MFTLLRYIVQEQRDIVPELPPALCIPAHVEKYALALNFIMTVVV